VKYRLSRALKRFVEFRQMDDEHMRYVYAAYRKGALANLGEEFESADLPAVDFKTIFMDHALRFYDDAWVMLATSMRGDFEPVGYVAITKTKYPNPLFVADTVWFPWASQRNRVESMLNWMNEMRKSVSIVKYASSDEDKKFCVHLCKYSVMRRIGTKFGVAGQKIPEFESRAA
jgi:hypothetical protein